MTTSTDIIHIDFSCYHVLAIDYDTEYSCESRGCGVDDYCRCGKIVNAKVEGPIKFADIMKCISVYIGPKTNKLIPYRENYDPSILEVYCFDRLFSIYKLYDPANWKVEVDGGYYGEEIEDVYPIENDKIISDIKEILTLDDVGKIKFILGKEYGHLLDVVTNSTTVDIQHIDSSILYKNNDYFYRIKSMDCRYELTPDIPIGVVCEKNGHYKLIDGYHRTVIGCSGTYQYVILRGD